MAVANYQYVQPVTPSNWTGEEKRYANQVIEVLDAIYAWRGRLTSSDLSDKGQKEIVKIVEKIGSFSSAQIKDLEATVATIASAYIKSATIDAAQVKDLYAEVMKCIVANIKTAEIDWADITTLSAAIATIATAQIGDANIDYAKIKDLTTDTAIIEKGTAGKLYIKDLAVTDANIVGLTVGSLVVRDDSGKYWRVSVDDSGNVTAKEATITGDNVDDESITGDKLVDNTITARELNAESIFADNAAIRELIAKNLKASTFFAQEATIEALKTAKIVGEKTLSIMASDLDKINAVFVVDADGTHVKATTGHAEVNTTPEGITMLDEKGSIITTIKNGEMETASVKVDRLTVGKLVTRPVAEDIVAEMWED